uniref:Cysteine protease n=1 Tax=Strigops habroptila TaxID=2489341 RepID=A0A672V2D7_STRHB
MESLLSAKDTIKIYLCMAQHEIQLCVENKNLDRNILVFLLGKCYRLKIDEFDFISRMWLTYGKEFLQLKRSALATDCGWGCAMTTGQMLLAQGLMLYFLGRAWVWPEFTILSNHSFGLHYSDVIDRQCSFLDSGKANTKAVFILVPVRLILKYCVGIIDGKPKQSYYFAGFQDDSLIYVHLHYCQLFVDVSIKDFRLESFHCPFPRKINIPLFTFVKGHSRDVPIIQTINPDTFTTLWFSLRNTESFFITLTVELAA